MSNKSDNNALEDEIKDLRLALEDALSAISTNQNVDLPKIGDMVETLTRRLQQEVITMEPDKRDAVLIELTQIVSGFGTLEEAIKAHALFPSEQDNGAEN